MIPHDETISELLDQYTSAALAQSQATEAGDHRKANQEHDKLASIYRELRHRGPSAQLALLPLLTHAALGVRLWAATHALEFAPEAGESVLRTIADIPKSLVSFSAKMTLQQWREGKLRFP